jgi:hypothetical protein
MRLILVRYMIFSSERFCIPKDEVAEAPHVLPLRLINFLDSRRRGAKMKAVNISVLFATLLKSFLRVTTEPVTAKEGSLDADRVPQAALFADL